MTELRQREPRERCKAYLAHIRTLPCLICSQKSEAAHIRMSCREIGKDITGGGRTSSDKWALPLCHDHHMEQHDAGSEIVFWNFYKLDAFVIAARLWDAWQKATGWTPRQPSKSQKPRMRKPRPSTKSERPKSKWPARPMRSRNTFAN
jgi:hypothetical protein